MNLLTRMGLGSGSKRLEQLLVSEWDFKHFVY